MMDGFALATSKLVAELLDNFDDEPQPFAFVFPLPFLFSYYATPSYILLLISLVSLNSLC